MTGQLIALLIIAAGIAALAFIYGHRAGRRSCRNEYPDGWDAGQTAERARWEDAAGIKWDAFARWQARRPEEPGPETQWPYDFSLDPALPATEVLLAAADTALGRPPRLPTPSERELDEMTARYEAMRGQPLRHPAHDEFDITEEEFEAAKRDLIERHGAIPPSLQKVIDRGGRFARQPMHTGADSHVRTDTCDCAGGVCLRQWNCRADPENASAPAEPGPPVVADITGTAAWNYPGEDDAPTVVGVLHPPGVPLPQPDRTGPDWLEHQLAEMNSDAEAYVRAMRADTQSYRLQVAAGRRPVMLP